jgi:tetratricopeptide (TPR) repeat protein
MFMIDLHDRYSSLIQTLLQFHRTGGSRSTDDIHRYLVEEIEPGSSEVFSHCLDDFVLKTQQVISYGNDHTQPQAEQALCRLKLIEVAWQRYQQELAAQDAISRAMFCLTTAASDDRLPAFLDSIDPNSPHPLSLKQLEQLASSLQTAMVAPERAVELQEFATGMQRGLAAWQIIEPQLVSWLQDDAGGANGAPAPRPWQGWSEQPIGVLPRRVFLALHTDQPLEDWAATCTEITPANWIELVLLLQRVQQGLLGWANQQPYDQGAAAKLINALYLGFASTWIQLANGCGRSTFLNSQNRLRFSQSALNMGLQFLRQFTQQPHFPFYGNPFTSLNGPSFLNTMHYLSASLQAADRGGEKGRVITLGGMFLRTVGRFSEATELHQSALDLAQAHGDRPSTIANLNHLSRLATIQSQYALAIEHGERALVLARQDGDRLGEANALTNLGYATAQQAHLRQSVLLAYEPAMSYLMMAVDMVQTLHDQPSEAFCAVNLAQICLDVNHPIEGLRWIQTGLQAAATCGDIYLQALSFTVMATACDQLGHPHDAIYAACLALHYFDRLNCREWRQPAALLSSMQERLGDRFEQLLQAELPAILGQIGAEGFAQIPTLIAQYQNVEPI